MSKYVEGWQIRHPDGHHRTIIGIAPLDGGHNGGKYRLWVGGCGVGTANTITEAREKLYVYLRDSAKSAIRDLEAEIQRHQWLLDTLGEGAHLFKLEAYHDD